MTSRQKLLASAVLGLTFVAGSLAGMVFEEALGLDWFDFLDAAMPEQTILDDLGLSAEQQRRAEAILDARFGELENYWMNQMPEMEAIIAESHDRIRALLDPEQKERFDRAIEATGIQVPEQD